MEQIWSPLSPTSNWGHLRWLDECQLCLVTWPISRTGIWQSAGALASSVTSPWTPAVQRSCWFLCGWCWKISPQEKNSWHYCPCRQLRGELTFITRWGSFLCRKRYHWKSWYKWLQTGLLISRHTGFIDHCKGDPDFPKFLLPLHHSLAGVMCKSDQLNPKILKNCVQFKKCVHDI